jgi:hypothetical protein
MSTLALEDFVGEFTAWSAGAVFIDSKMDFCDGFAGVVLLIAFTGVVWELLALELDPVVMIFLVLCFSSSCEN